MKEELRKLYEEYLDELEAKHGHEENYMSWDYPSITGFWEWVITGRLN